jgi:hypothetical protein
MPVFETTWRESGLVPTFTSAFSGITPSMNPDELKFNGSTRVATWLHFNEKDIKKQLNYLKGVGVNLIRVQLDMFAWAALGAEKFKKRIKTLTRLANDKKIYIQWVLFEAETADDPTGQLDPSSLNDAIVSGLWRYQRCPTISNFSGVTRHPSTMVVSGNQYIQDCVAAASQYKATVSWEIMSNVEFDKNLNPADASAYTFLASGVSKLRSIIPSTQKVTASFKYLAGDRKNPKYSKEKLNFCQTLDYVCYNLNNSIGPFKKYYNYIQALTLAAKIQKPLLVVNAGDWAYLNSLYSDIADTKDLNLGFIADGIIDFNQGARNDKSHRGMMHSDGRVKSSKDVNLFKQKALDHLESLGKLSTKIKNKYFTKDLIEQFSFEKLSEVELDFSEIDGSGGPFARWARRFSDSSLSAQWTEIRNSTLSNRATSAANLILDVAEGTLTPPLKFREISHSFAPVEFDIRSKKQGYSPVGIAALEIADLLKLINSEIFTSLNIFFTNQFYSLNFYNNDGTSLSQIIQNTVVAPRHYTRFICNELAYQKIKVLELLTEALPIFELDNIFEPESIPDGYPDELLPDSFQTAILDIYRPFAASAPWNPATSSVVPYASEPTLFFGFTNVPVSAADKPVCYFNRGGGFASGSCYYKPGVAVDPTVTATQDVYSKIDWARYDTVLLNWFQSLGIAYAVAAANFNSYYNRIKELEQDLFNFDPNAEVTNIVEVYEGPGTESLRSSSYSVGVLNGPSYENCYVFANSREAITFLLENGQYRNSLWTSGSSPVMNHTTFGCDVSASVRIKAKNFTTISSIDIKPASRKFEYSVTGNTISLKMQPKDRCWITVNNDTSNPLFVFANELKPPIPTERCLYFGPGVHQLSALQPYPVQVTGLDYDNVTVVSATFYGTNYSSLPGYVSGQNYTIYLDGGSYVVGQFWLTNPNYNNIFIVGPGVLAGDNVTTEYLRDPRWPTAVVYPGALAIHGAYVFFEPPTPTFPGGGGITIPVNRLPTSMVVSGITLVNTPHWGIIGVNLIDNVKILSPWTFATDAAAVVPDPNTKRAVIRDCFYLISDDAIRYPLLNMRAPESITAWGGNFEISGCQAYTVGNCSFALSYEGIYYSSVGGEQLTYPCIIRDNDAGMFSNGKNAEAMFRLQTDLSSTYSALYENHGVFNVNVKDTNIDSPMYVPLFWIGNIDNPFAVEGQLQDGDQYGLIKDITFENVSATWHPDYRVQSYRNLFYAKDANNKPKDITFKNVCLNGRYLTSGNFYDYFIVSGPVDIAADNIKFETPFALTNSSVEIYPNPFLSTEGNTNLNLSAYRDVSATRYGIKIYDDGLGKFVSSFVYKCKENNALAPWTGNPYNVYGTGNISGVEGASLGIAPWGTSAEIHFNYINFGISATTDVKVEYKGNPVLATSSISIGPKRKNKKFTVLNTSSFIIHDVVPYDKLLVELNFDTSNPLYVFANPLTVYPENYIKVSSMDVTTLGGAGDTIYFGPGFHEFSAFGNRNTNLPPDDGISFSCLPVWSFAPKSNQNIFLAPGAYIRGNFDAAYASSINFYGRGVVDNHWLQDWNTRTSRVENSNPKIGKSFIAALSSFGTDVRLSDPEFLANYYIAGGTLEGWTIVNYKTYSNTYSLNNIDNIKIINGEYYNADGPAFYAKFETPLDANIVFNAETLKFDFVPKYVGSLTRSYLELGDDNLQAGVGANSVIVYSGNYVRSGPATPFRSYFGYYDKTSDFEILKQQLQTLYPQYPIGEYRIGVSAINNDFRCYNNYSYPQGTPAIDPYHNRSLNSIVGLWISEGADIQNRTVKNFYLSQFYVENLIDIPLLDIGFRNYPFLVDGAGYGNDGLYDVQLPVGPFDPITHRNPITNEYRPGKISNIILEDIEVSSHPSSTGRYAYSSSIFGLKPDHLVADITLKNVKIDGVTITDDNFRNYISFKYERPKFTQQLLTTLPGVANFYPSSVAELYFIIGDSIAEGSGGQASAVSSFSDYSSIASGVSGCYIFRGISSVDTTAEFGPWTGPRFEKFRTGKNLNPETYSPNSIPGYNLAAEVSLFNTLRKTTKNDIYVVKLTRGGSVLPYDPDNLTYADWSVSSSNKMFAKFRDWTLSAVQILRNERKYIDFKGGVICLGTNLPTYSNNIQYTQSILQSEVSSFYNGIRSVFVSGDVEGNLANIIWALPRFAGIDFGGAGGKYQVNLLNPIVDASEQDYRLRLLPLSTINNYLVDTVHPTTEGHLKLGELYADIFYRATESLTDPELRPGVNIKFISGNTPQNKVNRISYEIYHPQTEAVRSSKYTVELFDNLDYSSAYVFARGREAMAFSFDEFGVLRNKFWTAGSTPTMHFLTFGTSATTKVRVGKIGENIKSVDIRPRSKNIQYEIKDDGFAYIDMSATQKAWVTINNEVSSPLFIFADKFKPVMPQGARGMYFGPGIFPLSAIPGPHLEVILSGTDNTDPGNPVEVFEVFYGMGFSSFNLDIPRELAQLFGYNNFYMTPYVEGEDYYIYVDGGAYVIGTFNFKQMNNIKVIGPGIISAENIPKERLENPFLDRRLVPFPGVISNGELMLARDHLYPDLLNVCGILDYARFPKRNVVSGVTLLETCYYGPRGFNYIDNMKIISPWTYNTDNADPFPDVSKTNREAVLTNSFVLVSDDASYPTTNSYIPGTHIGGPGIISGCQFYTMANGCITHYGGSPYHAFQSSAYPVLMYDLDIGQYSLPGVSSQTLIRLTADASSSYVNAARAVFPDVLIGTTNITLSSIRVEDPIPDELFWIGNIPDPFGNDPLEPTKGDGGDQAGRNRRIVIADITASSTNNYVSSNPILGRDFVSGNFPQDILFKNIKINNYFVTDDNVNNFINWDTTQVIGGFNVPPISVNPKFYPEVNINFSINQPFALSAFSSAGSLTPGEIYSGPQTSSLRSNYDVRVYRDGYYAQTYVYSATRQAWAPLSGNSLFASGSYPPMNWVTIGCSGPIGLKVPSVTSVDIKPKSKNFVSGYDYEIINNSLYIVLNPLDKIWLTINNQVSSPLFIFADELKPEIPTTGNVVYFAPGISSIGNYEVTSDDTTFYFDGGAVVKGSFDIRNKSNIKFIGPGILMPMDTSTAESFHTQYGNRSFQEKVDSGYVMIRGNYYNPDYLGSDERVANGNVVNGLTMVNTPWHSIFGGISIIDNFKLISPWYHSTYGPSIVADSILKAAQFTNSFIFNGDNCLLDFAKNSIFPANWSDGNITISNLFINNVNNAPIALYNLNYHPTNERPYKVSVNNIDVGLYQNPIKNLSNPSSVLSVFHIFNTDVTPTLTVANPNIRSHQGITFANIRVDNYLDCPIFRIVNASSPFGYPSNQLVSGNYGSCYNLTFENITASGYVSSVSGNSISGIADDYLNRPHDLIFQNIKINSEFITTLNYTNYFKFSDSTDPNAAEQDPNIFFQLGGSIT